jgi:hypothetical protein
MWFTVLYEHRPIGVVDLPPAGLTAGTMEPLAGYEAIAAITRAATAALLAYGFFGAALPPLPPFPGAVLRARRAIARAARLNIALEDARGARADASFVNVLEAPGDHRVVVVAGFPTVGALLGALPPPPPNAAPGGRPSVSSPSEEDRA